MCEVKSFLLKNCWKHEAQLWTGGRSESEKVFGLRWMRLLGLLGFWFGFMFSSIADELSESVSDGGVNSLVKTPKCLIVIITFGSKNW